MNGLLKLTGFLPAGRDISGIGNRISKGTKAREYSGDRKVKILCFWSTHRKVSRDNGGK